MLFKPVFPVLMMVFGVAGCGLFHHVDDHGLPTSMVKLDGRAPITQSQQAVARFSVATAEVTVPHSLHVSEANYLYPAGDIVWRGEPPGDRYAQVQAIVEDGLTAGVATLKQGPKAVVLAQVERFHALSEVARYSIGGVHDVVLVLTVKDAKTGAVLEGPRRVEIAIRASGNDAAIAEDIAGRTQRVVIVDSIAEAIRRELSGPLRAATP